MHDRSAFRRIDVTGGSGYVQGFGYANGTSGSARGPADREERRRR